MKLPRLSRRDVLLLVGWLFLSVVVGVVAVFGLILLSSHWFGATEWLLGLALPPSVLAEGADTVHYQALFLLLGTTLSISGTIFVGLLVYSLVTSSQEKATETSLEIERLRLLHELEDDFEAISMQPALFVKNGAKGLQSGVAPFRMALTHRVIWEYAGRNEEITPEGKRTTPLNVAEDIRIDSDTLHLVQLWFRRAYRARRAEVIRTDDLYVIWRLILPFAVHKRLDFFGRFFGPSMDVLSRDDIREMEFLMTELLHHILENRSEESSAVHYLRKNGPVDDILLKDSRLCGHPQRSLFDVAPSRQA